MVGTKPNAYLTEESRLEAQRRMLQERYGLLSDESDDDPPPNGMSHNGQPPQNGAHADDAAVDSSSYSSRDAITYLPDAYDITHDKTTSDPPPPDRPTGWPAVHIVNPNQATIMHRFDYSARKHPDPSPRHLRVTQITVYASHFQNTHSRKIAVNDHIITYAVGSHIRAILRNSTVRSLLKGHDAPVADIEFLSLSENRLEPSGDNISILGSVAEDGSVYVWKIVRNDSGEQDTLADADAIRFDHKDQQNGRSYQRIAFRPGPNSIIAENGIGVAMLLLDTEDTDLRVVEMVKMNEKMMVRDKFLKAKSEVSDGSPKADGPLDAACWLSERILATSRGGHVFLWNADSTFSTCIAKIPRENNSRVSGLHPLANGMLLLLVNNGRQVELWHATDLSPDTRTSSLTLCQTLKLFPDDVEDEKLFCIAAVDPTEQVVMISNAKGLTFFALHYNAKARAFDTITEVPGKQPILSFCMTRNDRKIHSSSPVVPPSASIDADAQEDLGVWCVQPRGIQLIHLPARDCSPTTTLLSEVFPKPISKTVTCKTEKIPANLMQPMPVVAANTPKPRDIAKNSLPQQQASKRVPRSLGSVKNRAPSPSTMSPKAPDAPQKTPSKRDPSPSPPPVAPRVAVAQKASLESKHHPPVAPPPPAPAHPKQYAPPPAAPPKPQAPPPPSIDDIADAVLGAAKKVITNFEDNANQRSAIEKVKMDRLIETVTESAESNLERFVNSSMKKVLNDTLIPTISQMITEYRATLRERSKANAKLSTEHFEHVIQDSNISRSFANACNEMSRQVSTAVNQSMISKYDSLIQPTVDIVNDAAEDLSNSVSLLQKEVSKLKPTDLSAPPGTDEVKKEDVRPIIERQIVEENVDGAFLTALDKEDLLLVTWLCRKFESSTFFETNSLSQIAMLALAQQLGHGLSGDDVEFKVDWLRELMLELKPESGDIEAHAQSAIEGLLDKVNELRQKKELVNQYDGLEKKLKTLGRLISSHILS